MLTADILGLPAEAEDMDNDEFVACLAAHPSCLAAYQVIQAFPLSLSLTSSPAWPPSDPSPLPAPNSTDEAVRRCSNAA